MKPGTEANPRVSLYWRAQKGPGVIHRAVIENGRFLTFCGRWLGPAEVQAEPQGTTTSGNDCTRCRNQP